MYLLTIKDGLETRYIGPYSTTNNLSEDLQRVLADFSERARWKIHKLESPMKASYSRKNYGDNDLLNLRAS